MTPATPPGPGTLRTTRLAHILAYNTGRIASYSIAGALVGGLAGGIAILGDVARFQMVAAWLVNMMLMALGLYLMEVWRGIARLEQIGQHLWRRLTPLMKWIMASDRPPGAMMPSSIMLLGALWGWLPCGMVYSMLITAMFSGSASSGALVMLAFGLGTLPMLLTMGWFGSVMKRLAQRRPVRLAAGLIVLAFGLLGLVRATQLAHIPASWFCITPAISSANPTATP